MQPAGASAHVGAVGYVGLVWRCRIELAGQNTAALCDRGGLRLPLVDNPKTNLGPREKKVEAFLRCRHRLAVGDSPAPVAGFFAVRESAVCYRSIALILTLVKKGGLINDITLVSNFPIFLEKGLLRSSPGTILFTTLDLVFSKTSVSECS